MPYQDLRHGSALYLDLTSFPFSLQVQTTDLVLLSIGVIFLSRVQCLQTRFTAALAGLYSSRVAIDQHLDYSSRKSSVRNQQYVLLDFNICSSLQSCIGAAFQSLGLVHGGRSQIPRAYYNDLGSIICSQHGFLSALLDARGDESGTG